MQTRIEVGSTYMRSVYSRMMQALGLDPQDNPFIISEKTLILERELVAGQNSYRFNLYENNNERPLEKKLNRNDGFVISHLALTIRKQDTSTTPKQYGNFPDFTHPDANYFVGVASSINESDCLENIYAGDLTLTTNNTKIIEELSTEHFRFVPERGYTVAAGSQTRDEWPQYGPSLEEKGFYPYSVNAILNGADNNEVTLNLGAGNYSVIAGGVNAAGASVNTSNVVRVKLHGFEIAEAAQAALKWGTF